MCIRDQYTFRVLDDAHKVEIRQAVEELFDVTVTDVRTIQVRSKPKRRGRSVGRRPGEGRLDRVRPQPHVAYRPVALRRWREALHPGASSPRGGRHGHERPG